MLTSDLVVFKHGIAENAFTEPRHSIFTTISPAGEIAPSTSLDIRILLKAS